MQKVSDLFDVAYGVNLELNAIKRSSDGINFVSRTAKNNGVSAKVQLIPGIIPIPAGTISVAGGGSVMASFLQTEPYYSGRDLYYLTSKEPMTENVKLFYCKCLQENRYRYSYGRQANRTLKDILLPSISEIPEWVKFSNVNMYDGANAPVSQFAPPNLDSSQWKKFTYEQLFTIERGKGPRIKDLNGQGNTPFITSIDGNNGLNNVTTMNPCHQGNVIGVNRNGSVAEAFYQPLPFCSTEDVHIFIPKFELNPYRAMFLCTLIKQEKYRFGYGRKWGIERMKKTEIRLPMNQDGNIDWLYMENYIKSLPFSAMISV
jgi:hypothetical protein